MPRCVQVTAWVRFFLSTAPRAHIAPVLHALRPSKSSCVFALYILLLRHPNGLQLQRERCESDSDRAVAAAVAVILTVTVTVTNQPNTSTQVLAAGFSDASDASDALPTVSTACGRAGKRIAVAVAVVVAGAPFSNIAIPRAAPHPRCMHGGCWHGWVVRKRCLLEGWEGARLRGSAWEPRRADRRAALRVRLQGSMMVVAVTINAAEAVF